MYIHSHMHTHTCIHSRAMDPPAIKNVADFLDAWNFANGRHVLQAGRCHLALDEHVLGLGNGDAQALLWWRVEMAGVGAQTHGVANNIRIVLFLQQIDDS